MTRIQSVSILGWFGQPIPRHLNQVTNHNFATTTTDGTPSVEGGGTAFTGIASSHRKQSQQASIASKHSKQSQQAITASKHSKQAQQARKKRKQTNLMAPFVEAIC
jgi:hypothetical protein